MPLESAKASSSTSRRNRCSARRSTCAGFYVVRAFVAKGALDAAAHRHAGPTCLCDHLVIFDQRLGHRAIGVAPAVIVTGRQRDIQVIRSLPHVCAFDALQIQDQRTVGHVRQHWQRRTDLFGVGHLGHSLGMHERGDLDTVQAGSCQIGDQLDLLCGRKQGVLALEPVAGSNLDDLNVGRQSDSKMALD